MCLDRDYAIALAELIDKGHIIPSNEELDVLDIYGDYRPARYDPHTLTAREIRDIYGDYRPRYHGGGLIG